MRIDFYKTDCQKRISEKRFGLYDAEDKTPAKIIFTENLPWNATIINKGSKEILFTAIDNCIDVFKENGDMDSRCDCMLSYDSTLMLIELKNKRDSWQIEGLDQIENIAQRMISENSDYYYSFKKRKAVVANRKKQSPAFQYANVEQRQYFRSKYKMRIQFEAEIIIE